MWLVPASDDPFDMFDAVFDEFAVAIAATDVIHNDDDGRDSTTRTSGGNGVYSGVSRSGGDGGRSDRTAAANCRSRFHCSMLRWSSSGSPS